MEALKPLGRDMAARLVEAMAPQSIEGYGKGAVSAWPATEQGALWHVPGDYGMRDLLEKARTPSCPSTKKSARGRHRDRRAARHKDARLRAQPSSNDRDAVPTRRAADETLHRHSS